MPPRNTQARPARLPNPVDTPRGLSLDVLSGDGEFAVFSWDAGGPAPRAPLTPAEREVLELVVQGLSNAEIAQRRKASVRTVANQVASVLKKLGAPSRYQLIVGGSPHDRKG